MMLPQTPTFRLEGKRALVTGAGRGIGLAATAALAQAGAHVTLLARSAAELDSAVVAIRAAGGLADALVADVLHIPQVTTIISDNGPFDILVNSAGTNRPMLMQHVTEADYNAVLDLNVRATFFVTQAVAAGLIAVGRPGSLIHIGSQMGHVGARDRTLYCASKWALEGMNKAIALEMAEHGIRSNTIAPTFTETALTAPYFQDKDFLQTVLAKIKLGRLGKVEDLMGAILYLASGASAMVTGTSLIVDGGWTAE